jgi:Pyruvate/2-oxoacid:ferredoxin oxidoreductase gamma subunit
MAVTNIILAGIGGQGINSLAGVMAEYFQASGYTCQYTVHKGGAQSLGSVYAEIRMAAGDLSVLGPGIPAGMLDILIALDPWEAIRHLPLAHTDTRLWVEQETMPMFVDRDSATAMGLAQKSPQRQLEAVPLKLSWQPYRQMAKSRTGSARMANYFAGSDCLKALNLFDQALYHSIFYKRISRARTF